jgi:hypothetical protein
MSGSWSAAATTSNHATQPGTPSGKPTPLDFAITLIEEFWDEAIDLIEQRRKDRQ